MIPDFSGDRHLGPLASELRESIAYLPRNTPNALNEQLRLQLSSCICSCIEAILRIVANARFGKTHPEHLYFSEAFFRRFWDLLLECALNNLEGPVAVAAL